MFMVQNNQTSVWYRFRLRSQMTLTGLKHQNEPNKVAAQQLIQIYIIVQNEQKNKFTSSIDSRMMKFTLHGGQVVWHVTRVNWFGKGLPTTNSTRFVPSYQQPFSISNSTKPSIQNGVRASHFTSWFWQTWKAKFKSKVEDLHHTFQKERNELVTNSLKELEHKCQHVHIQ